MLEDVVLKLEEIYVPVKRRKTLDEAKVEAIAESIIESGQHQGGAREGAPMVGWIQC